MEGSGTAVTANQLPAVFTHGALVIVKVKLSDAHAHRHARTHRRIHRHTDTYAHTHELQGKFK